VTCLGSASCASTRTGYLRFLPSHGLTASYSRLAGFLLWSAAARRCFLSAEAGFGSPVVLSSNPPPGWRRYKIASKALLDPRSRRSSGMNLRINGKDKRPAQTGPTLFGLSAACLLPARGRRASRACKTRKHGPPPYSSKRLASNHSRRITEASSHHEQRSTSNPASDNNCRIAAPPMEFCE